jgi:hypothetical protein
MAKVGQLDAIEAGSAEGLDAELIGGVGCRRTLRTELRARRKAGACGPPRRSAYDTPAAATPGPCYASRVSQPQRFEEAIQALRRDPTHPVRLKVDEELTVEVRAVHAGPQPKRSAADVFRELGRWEGETGEDLDALFARQPSNRRVPDLPWSTSSIPTSWRACSMVTSVFSVTLPT